MTTRSTEDLQQRTKKFALQVIRLVGALPKSVQAQVIGRQLLRSATSVGANYRAACRARSRADFVAKIGIVEGEADETLYWLELLCEARIVQADRIDTLMKEANELVAIFVSSGRTAKGYRRASCSESAIPNRKLPIRDAHSSLDNPHSRIEGLR